MFRRVIFAFAIVCLFTAPASAAWVHETVASAGDQGQSAALAVDDNDRPHVAWYDASFARLMYAYRDFGGWHVTEIDTGQVGSFCDIAINPIKNRPAIAYYDDSIDAAMFAYQDDDGVWKYETIEDAASYDRGRWISLAFTTGGQAWAAYHYDDGWSNDNGVRVAWRTGANAWSKTAPDSVYNAFGERLGSWTAIALSTVDLPNVAYRDDVWSNQKFAWLDGTGWHKEDVVNAADIDSTGEHTGIAMDIGDNVYISMFFSPLIGDDCAVILKKVAGSWAWDEIECGGADTGKYSSIAIGTDNAPQVTYYAGGNLKYAKKVAGAWQRTVLESDEISGMYTSLGLDSRNAPHIAYYDAFAKDVKYVWDMPVPLVSSINPNTGENTQSLSGVTITGATFASSSTARLFRPDASVGVNCTGVSVTDPFELTCDLNLVGAWPGIYNVEVTNPAGTGSLAGAFTITSPAPELTSATPHQAFNNDPDFTMDLGGNFFTLDMTAKLVSSRAQINTTAMAVNTLTAAEATFDLTGAAVGDYDVVVTTPFGNARMDEALTIKCAPPVADFTGAPLRGPAPHTVNFFDNSEDYNGCRITQWEWDFGDGETASDQNPTHTFTEVGRYKIKLRVTGPGGSNTYMRNNYITVDPGADDDADDDDDDDDWVPPDDDETDDDDISIGDDDAADGDDRHKDEGSDSGGCGC